jgi:hypothetical protein
MFMPIHHSGPKTSAIAQPSGYEISLPAAEDDDAFPVAKQLRNDLEMRFMRFFQ